ncbi:MAG: hypothetical protein AAGH92_12420 [Planctomycetota bacterium]
MSHAAPKHLTDADTAVLGNRAGGPFKLLFAAGGLCLLLALILAVAFGSDWQGVRRFGFAYVTGYAFCMAVVMGCLFFTIITTLFRAGWCGMVRRVSEVFAACVPLMAVLFIPIAIFTVAGGDLYVWNSPELKNAVKHASLSEPEAPTFATVTGPTELIADDGESHDHDDDHHAHAHGEEHADGHGGHHGPPTYAGANSEDWATWYGGAVAYYVNQKSFSVFFLEISWFDLWFWAIRWVIYFGVFALIGVGYWKLSTKQDETGDPELTNKREKWAPLSVMAFALLVTFMTVDLLMSLDPVFFSTMFAVIFFANAFTAGLATIILTLTVLKKQGYLPSVTTDHFHDLGKLLFAFVFFWGYVSFSQFMLIWYANLPETTYWWEIRGGTTFAGTISAAVNGQDAAAPTSGSGWSWVLLFMLFFHLFLPFAILLSKHVKRHPSWRTVMAVCLLVLVYIDMYWYVMPVLSSPNIGLGYLPIDLLVGAGLICLLLAAAIKRLAKHSLVAKNDPRMTESLALDTNVWAPIHHAH